MGRFGFCLEVSGPFPSAARAIYSALLWKPAIRWRIDQIDVLAPIRWINIRRNEVGAVGGETPINAVDNRVQRASLMLRDVRYRIHAHFDFLPPAERPKVYAEAPDWLRPEDKDSAFIREAGPDEKPAKYAAMFERRARKGQCFIRPYLGCRECAADFKLIDHPAAEPIQPIPEDRDLGFMLYDLDFSNPKDPQPMFYHAKMTQGVITVPAPDSEEVKR